MPREFVIDQIFPVEQVHLIAGASGVGKSTWLLRMMVDWKDGKEVLGYPSFPLPFAYVSCDRGLSSIEATLERLEIDVASLPIIDGRGHGLPFVVATAKEKVPEVKVLFIEGFQSMAPSVEGSKLYGATSRFLLESALLAESQHLTIIGTAHTPKMKEKEGYPDPRQKVSGSAAWAAYSETIILIERPKADDIYDARRVLYVLPRNAREEKFEFKLDDRGRFVETTNDTGFFLLYEFLKKLPFDDMVPVERFQQFCSEKSIQRWTLFRWFSEAIEKAELERVALGIYKRKRRI